MATDWFSSQLNLYKASTDRSLLYVKLAGSQRLQAEEAKIEAKYDGSAAARIEEDINKLGDQKMALSKWLLSVDSGLKEFNTVREYLLQAKAAMAVATPSPAAFDLQYDALHSRLYNEKFDDTSLISNNTNNRGSWTDKTETVSAAGMSAELTHHYLANDYAIELSNGSVLTANTKGTLSGGGHTIQRANLQLVSRTGDQVEFQDVTDPANPVTLTGTVKRGGLGVLPSWLYGDLSDQAVKDEVNADLKTAFKKLARFELDFNVDQAQLSGMDSSLTSKMKSLQDDYDRVANEEMSAKLAEKKALKARFDIFNNSLALTSSNSTYYIQQMFNTTVGEKQSLTDVLLGAVGGS